MQGLSHAWASVDQPFDFLFEDEHTLEFPLKVLLRTLDVHDILSQLKRTLSTCTRPSMNLATAVPSILDETIVQRCGIGNDRKEAVYNVST